MTSSRTLERPQNGFHRVHYWIVLALLLVSNQSERIQALSSRRSFLSWNNRQSRTPAALIDAALLQTRGGGRRPKNKAAEPEEDSAEKENTPEPSETPEPSSVNDEEGEGEGEGEVKVLTEEEEQESSNESIAPKEEAVQQETSTAEQFDIARYLELPLHAILEQAAELRKQGKVSHDDGSFSDAAAQFHQAANLLEAGFEKELEESQGDDTTEVNLQEEWATCRLHESLCHLKAEDFEQCIEACSSLLDSKHTPAAMIRARAHHRRAKAKVGIDDIDGALVDARSAAFLGDRKAVTYYGKLLRDTGGSSSAGGMDAMFSPASPGAGAGFPDSSSLLESLLNKSAPNAAGSGGSPSDFLTSSLLGSLTGSPMSPGGFAGDLSGNGGGGGGLAKSVLKSLSKKLEDESTHDGICEYLQSTNPMQVQSMATMAGLQLSSGQASKLVSIAHGITPKTIRTTVKTTKRAIWGVQLIRKTMALLSKYKHVLFFVMLLQWAKSAVLRPIPVPKIKAPRAPRGRGANKAAKTNPNTNANNLNTAKPKAATPGIINNNLAAAVAGR